MKRAEQLEKTRQSIMRTATKLFLQKGFGETSTRDIAKQVGITQPALYHHFSDKEVLYLDVMTNLSSKVRKDINKVFGTYQPIGGHNISDDQRDQLILDCIISGLSKTK